MIKNNDKGEVLDCMVKSNIKCKHLKALNDSYIKERQALILNGDLDVPPRKYFRIFGLNNLVGYIANGRGNR